MQLIELTQIVDQETQCVLSRISEHQEVVLLPASNSLQEINQLWLLDYRLDGTFLIVSNTSEQLVLSCDSNSSKVQINRFNGDQSQLWSFDGGYIESVKFKGQVITLMPNFDTQLCLSAKNSINSIQLFQLEVRTQYYHSYMYYSRYLSNVSDR